MSDNISAAKVIKIVCRAASDTGDGKHHAAVDMLVDIVAARLRKIDPRFATMSNLDLEILLLGDIRADATRELGDVIAENAQSIRREIEDEVYSACEAPEAP